MLTFDALHAYIADCDLDSLATHGGVESQIGRLSFTADAVLFALRDRLRRSGAREVVDLGCGQGFLGRWLALNAPEIAYFGVDRSPAAIEKARALLPNASFACRDYFEFAGKTFDGVVILDSLFRDAVDVPLAQHLHGLMRAGGTLFVAAPMVSKRHAEIFRESVTALRSVWLEVAYEEWTHRVESSILEMASAWLDERTWPHEVETLFRSEALAVIKAINERTLTYATLVARKFL